MLTSLALVFLLGLAAAALCSRIGLPRIIGMLLTGILIGPYVLNWLDDSILSISSELRQMALIIILIKAGLSLNLSDLKKVGRPAVMMACVPASSEILAFFLLAPHILGINRIEAAVMGAVLGAVSPAVVVPRMVQLMEEKRAVHDLRYQVRDVNGNNLWIRCYGILKWNEDKSKPLFFSGRVTHQDKNFVVDPITNFPREHASFQQLDELRRLDERALVIGFSLNGFSEINTTKGRAYGDRLLKNVADALTKELFWKMSFFRLEGMRCMAVVNSSCMAEGQDALVEQIRAVIQKCYASMDVSVQNFCSFGIMEYPNGAMTPDDLVENLVSLIRVAKQDARRDYVDYSTPNIQRIKQMSNMVLALSQNVANQMEHFRIVIQPIVSAADGAVIGGEVLLRWTFEGKDVSPATFIPILEKIGLIHTVGRWVFGQATSTCVRLQSHDPAFYLTFNMSLHQLSDPQLLPFMKETLEKYRLSGSSLVAELTESCLDEQPEKLTGFVQACQKLGIFIALDDFGSGYSSLRMLLQYPSSIIKLDRSLVREMAQSTAKMHFIQSIVFPCQQFRKNVSKEGVESAEQIEMIRNTGCDMIQGYYHYRPMELSQMYHLVSQTGSGKQGKEASACRS